MTLQWTLVAAFLYCEIAFLVLILLPILSARVWQKIFKSRFCQAFAAQANLYFMILIAILILLFLDSIREMRKYSGGLAEHEHSHLDAEMQLNMKLFRAQRNFYIAGFALFLWLVIRKMVTLILNHATLLNENEASMRQAQSATAMAERLLKEKEEIERKSEEDVENKGNAEREAAQAELDEAKKKLSKVEEDLMRAESNVIAMQKQASAVSKEYDTLLTEHGILQEKYDKLSGSAGDKKDD